jgi:hypothetical protein
MALGSAKQRRIVGTRPERAGGHLSRMRTGGLNSPVRSRFGWRGWPRPKPFRPFRAARGANADGGPEGPPWRRPAPQPGRYWAPAPDDGAAPPPARIVRRRCPGGVPSPRQGEHTHRREDRERNNDGT